MRERKNILPDDQMLTVLDHTPVAILVSGIDDYEVIYRNKQAEKFFSQKQGQAGVKCYEAAGRSTPYPYCEMDNLSEAENPVRRFHFPEDNRFYQRRGKIINLDGRPIHIEYILDITEVQREKENVMAFKEELEKTNERMQFIINTVPGGIAIYKVSDIFETVYFSDGVPELTGHTVEEYKKSLDEDTFQLVYHEDKERLLETAREGVKTHQMVSAEFRKKHKDGHIVWIRAQAKWIGEEEGYPLLHCVFQNISDLKAAQLEMNHLVNSIPGGIASYHIEKERFISTYFSDGVAELSGHTRSEMEEMVREDAFHIIYEGDRERVADKVKEALISGESLDVSYRMRHKKGNLIWIHLNGRRIDPLSESIRFYAVFTGMTAESRLFESIAEIRRMESM